MSDSIMSNPVSMKRRSESSEDSSFFFALPTPSLSQQNSFHLSIRALQKQATVAGA